jgi:hypothetical protein
MGGEIVTAHCLRLIKLSVALGLTLLMGNGATRIPAIGSSIPGPLAATPPIATLSNGEYQVCHQPDPQDWRDGAGVCLRFSKVDQHITGYYGYPHSDHFVCLRGQVVGDRVTGKALTFSWAGDQWTSVPTADFKWDQEGRLVLGGGSLEAPTQPSEGSIERVYFERAVLDVSGFYLYRAPRLRPPQDLCPW